MTVIHIIFWSMQQAHPTKWGRARRRSRPLISFPTIVCCIDFFSGIIRPILALLRIASYQSPSRCLLSTLFQRKRACHDPLVICIRPADSFRERNRQSACGVNYSTLDYFWTLADCAPLYTCNVVKIHVSHAPASITTLAFLYNCIYGQLFYYALMEYHKKC